MEFLTARVTEFDKERNWVRFDKDIGEKKQMPIPPKFLNDDPIPAEEELRAVLHIKKETGITIPSWMANDNGIREFYVQKKADGWYELLPFRITTKIKKLPEGTKLIIREL